MSMTQGNVPGVDPQIQAATDAFRRDYRAIQAEIAKAIVGHHEIVDGVLTCLFVGGHALLEGVPGLGKTALIRALPTR
jgi:MoxR-like ATPase